MYRHLFTPIELGPIKIPNRVVFSAHLTNLAENNLPGAKLIAYYRERAKGGAGLIITEEQSVHASDFAYEKLIHAYHAQIIPHYRRLTTTVKNEGAKIFCQLNHNGAQGFSFFNDEPLWGPSLCADTLFREYSQAIDETQIAEVIAGYGQVAGYVREGGFDGIELQASHSSILRQFMSPYSNHRNDQWGGSIENRLRLTEACLRAVRESAGAGLAVGIRLCTDELLPGGLQLPDVLAIAERLDSEGLVDFINTSIGTTGQLHMVEGPMSVPAGYQIGHTAAIRERVQVPVLGVGRVNDPMLADRLLSEGQCDLIGVVRGQIADAEWAKKSQEGQAADIRKCIACNQYCIGLMGLNAPLSCIQNPANGQEAHLGMSSYHSIRPKKTVWVIGAGPAGMEAAIVAAHHGQQVLLFDAADRLGGNVNWIIKTPQRQEYGDLIRNKSSELKRYGVTIQLNQQVTAEDILAAQTDAVIIATGQTETRPAHIPGIDGDHVSTPLTLLAGARPQQESVLIVDEIGFHQASSLAEYLVEGGCQVSMVTSSFYVGQHLGVTLDLELWHMRMAQHALRLYEGYILLDAGPPPLLLNIHSGQQTTLDDITRVVVVQHGQPNADLYHALSGKIDVLYRVGDALAPKEVGQAILDGHRAARKVCGMNVLWQ